MQVTIEEIFNLSLWDRYCRITGTNEWAVNEGRLDRKDTVELPDELARELIGLTPYL
jgi:hypothetical protein